jgi:hypothetical protein
MRKRLWTGFMAAWLAGSIAGTAIVWAYVGPSAARTALPVFAVIAGLWVAAGVPFALLRARRQCLTPTSVYAFAAISSLFATTAFFLLFVYFLMFCLPVVFFVAALTFHAVALQARPDEPVAG